MHFDRFCNLPSESVRPLQRTVMTVGDLGCVAIETVEVDAHVQ